MSKKDYAPPSTTRSSSNKAAGKSKAKAKPKTASKKSAPKAAAPEPPSSGGRGKLFLSLAILIGGFGYGLYFLQSIPPAAPLEDKAQVTQKKAQPESNQSAKEETQRFKFYDLLPQSEVTPPKVSAYQFKEKDLSDSYYYVVQTGSFKNLADAERQKATIAFQGLKGSIKSVENSSGTTWHRVSTGPFYTRTDMNSALDKLVAIDIQPLVKKIKIDN